MPRNDWRGIHRMKKIAILLGVTVVLMAGLAFVRTLRYQPSAPAVVPAPAVTLTAAAVERLAGSIRIPTISHEDPAAFDAAAFRALHDHLEAGFPRVHARLQRETVATHSLLYAWRGSDPSLQPILLAAHLDVVPIEAGTQAQWEEAPFSGRVADGFVWGRGSIDNKSAVVGTLEAVEMLLSEGFQPARTIYLAYGHDEEVGGTHGARGIAALLQARGVQLEMVLDEGGVIGDGIVAGIAAPVALVGIAEKGYVSLALGTRAAGGHSSLPPQQSAIGVLSAAIVRLEENPLPARLDGATQMMLERLGSSFAFPQRAALANLWLTKPLVVRILENDPSTNAMVRTTTAVTMFQAGTKDNVLASRAEAVVNLRIAPGDSVARVLEHVQRVIDDPRVDVTVTGAFTSEPSAMSSTASESFRSLERTIREVVPEAVVAPYLVVVITDARHYEALSDNVFRFLPVRLAPQDLQRMHGTNERLAVRDYERAVRFFRELILNAAAS